MKINHFFYFIIISLVTTSCNIQKKKYSNGFFVSKNQGIVKSTGYASQHDEVRLIDVLTNQKGVEKKEAVIELESEIQPQQIELYSEIINQDTVCDVIVFKDLSEVKCIVKEVNPETIKYSKCGFENGPIVTIRRDKVSSILYRNGQSDSFASEESLEEKEVPVGNNLPTLKKVEGFGLASFFIGIGALFMPISLIGLAILMVLTCVVFGFISLSRFTKEPEKYKGKAFTILGLVIGLISVIAIFSLFI